MQYPVDRLGRRTSPHSQTRLRSSSRRSNNNQLGNLSNQHAALSTGIVLTSDYIASGLNADSSLLLDFRREKASSSSDEAFAILTARVTGLRR
jgi:hypothetical protein